MPDVIEAKYRQRYKENGPRQDEVRAAVREFVDNNEGKIDLKKFRQLLVSLGIAPNRWEGKNPGMWMMNLCNVLRPRLEREGTLVIGNKTLIFTPVTKKTEAKSKTQPRMEAMEALSFDTHSFVKKLTKAGMPEPQAEVLAEEQSRLLEYKLATKRDIAEIKQDIAGVKKDIAEVKKDIVEIRHDIAELRAETRRDIAGVKKDIAEVKKDIVEIRHDIAELRAETKKDIAEVKKDIAEVKKDIVEIRHDIAGLRAETKKDIAEVKHDIAELRAETKKDIAEIKVDILKWLFGALLGQTALLAALIKLV